MGVGVSIAVVILIVANIVFCLLWLDATCKFSGSAKLFRTSLESKDKTIAILRNSRFELIEDFNKLSAECVDLRKQIDAANEQLAFDDRVQSLQEQLSVVLTERDELRLEVEMNELRSVTPISETEWYKALPPSRVGDMEDFATRHDSIGVVKTNVGEQAG